jgi:UDP-N-acetylglucosamine 4,6-dehydratase
MSTLAGRSVLITGGTGSFGRAFARKALADGASRVVVFSRDEAKQAAMRADNPDPRLRFFIGDVRDEARVVDACRGVDVVVHAAAMKRVESCEADPAEAVATNITGTRNVARACVANHVDRAVFLSTDKAAAPNTLYGMTKATAERLWNQSNVFAAGTQTRFSATRYGNVLGSTGSVVPLWRSQAERGEPITVTDPAMSRFWMEMSEAVDLVLLALREMRGGEVFVPKIGSSRILDLAEMVAPGSPLRTIGVRPGEKIHETLVTEDEARSTYDCGTHYVIEPESRTWGDVEPPPHPKVPAGFVYRSDSASPLTPDHLNLLAA